MDTPGSLRRVSARLSSCTSIQGGCGTSASPSPRSGHKRQHISEPSNEKKRLKESQQQANNSRREKSRSRKSKPVEEIMENVSRTSSTKSQLPEINIQTATPCCHHVTRLQLKHLQLNSPAETVKRTSRAEVTRDSKMVKNDSTMNSKSDNDCNVTACVPDTSYSEPDRDNMDRFFDHLKPLENIGDVDGDERSKSKNKTDRLSVGCGTKISRRSSFACGRKSKVLPVFSAHTFGEMCIQSLEKNDIFKVATNSERLVPNPSNETTQSRITSLLAYTNKLSQEFDRWNELLQEHTSATEIIERRSKTLNENPLTERPSCGLTGHEEKLVDKRMDYKEMMSRLQNYKNQTFYAVKSISAVVKTFQQFQHLTNEKLKEQARLVYNKTFPDMKRNEEDPQKLIEAVLEFKD
ncbi:hypothetical protein LSH36_21g11076 [Paralvinella palmiformis]|uniref:Uncharacterized protein n=1 Tax=Paralvinella palmiformis TaxID=53620 RepID=A0AAD9NI68_9ANNE|nr:hypothetical protein LSH36_21g11076 [Paralvinella palmiformis]